MKRIKELISGALKQIEDIFNDLEKDIDNATADVKIEIEDELRRELE